MDWVIGLIFICALVFLANIYGDRLSVLGIASDKWLRAPLDLLVWFWSLTCQMADRIWCFVVDHFWWVTAAASGGVGLLLIALMFATGIANKAEADRLIIHGVIPAGGALDHTAIVKADAVRQVSSVATEPEFDRLVYQTPSNRGLGFFPIEPRDVVTDFGDRKQVEDVPPLDISTPVYRPPSSESNSQLRISLRSFVERTGRPVQSRQTQWLIEDALRNLRQDEWQTFSRFAAQERDQPGRFDRALRPEDPQWKVDELEAGVRVVPGAAVAAQDLTVEKSVPENVGNGPFDLQIRITNESAETVDGLIVREALPQDWQVIEMQPDDGAYRDSVATWLVRNLRPQEQAVLNLQLLSDERGSFQSFTEVSATAAVSNAVDIRDRRPVDRSPVTRRPERPREPPPREEPREERPLPPVERLPKVELRLSKPPAVVEVGQDADVYFSLRNVGDAPAEGVSLRVQLPYGLDHHDLDPNEIDRQVDAKIRTLAVGERRQVRLTVQPTEAGRHFSTAELRLRNAQLDIREFQINAVAAEEPPAPAPQPEQP